MSHFTTITTQIKDIEALEKACGEMGLPERSTFSAAFDTNIENLRETLNLYVVWIFHCRYGRWCLA